MDTKTALLQLSLADLERRLRGVDRALGELRQRVATLEAHQCHVQIELAAVVSSLQALWDFVTPEEPVVVPHTTQHSIIQTFLGDLNSLD